MEFTDKLKVVIATIGRAEAAKKLGINYQTLIRKTKKPDLWKLGEMKILEEIYRDCAGLPLK